MYLNNHSYYSLRYGTFSIEDLVDRAQSLGIQTLALTDINNTMGMVDFVKACRRKGMKPIAGVEFRNGDELLYVALARNNSGFRALNEMLTQHNLSGMAYPQKAPDLSDVVVIYPFGMRLPAQLSDNEFLGVRLSQVPKLLRTERELKKDKLVLLQPVTFSDEAAWYIHKNLRAIDHNILLSKL